MLAEASAIQTAFQTGIEAIKTDALGMITVALPVCLGIVGVFLAVKFGMKFFKSISNKA